MFARTILPPHSVLLPTMDSSSAKVAASDDTCRGWLTGAKAAAEAMREAKMVVFMVW